MSAILAVLTYAISDAQGINECGGAVPTRDQSDRGGSNDDVNLNRRYR